MRSDLFEIPSPTTGRLSTMAHPRGGDWLDDEMVSLREAGVDVIVSLQTESERVELQLTAEPEAARRHGIDYHSLPIIDFGVPGQSEVELLLEMIDAALTNGKHVAIHCRGGVGRSSLIAGALLIRHGVSPADACATISTARGRDVPESAEQRTWLDERVNRPRASA
jgi:protein-tyrosine phosphatase